MSGKKILAVTVLSLILVTGCAKKRNAPLKPEDWIRDSVSKELEIQVPINAVSIIQNFQLDSINPAIIAAVKVDQLNGGCFIYQWREDKYQLTYRKKEPVYNLQLSSTGRHLVFESGFTGTGQKNTFFYLVEFGAGYCMEIWKEVATGYNFTSVGPYDIIDASIKLSSDDQNLIYTKIQRTYLKTEMDLNKPDSIKSSSKLVLFSQLPSRKQE